jgi:hypothetical protein
MCMTCSGIDHHRKEKKRKRIEREGPRTVEIGVVDDVVQRRPTPRSNVAAYCTRART